MGEEDLTDHKKLMLKHLKKKKRSLASLLADDDDNGDEENDKKPFELTTAPRFELDKELLRSRIKSNNMRTMAYAMDIARTREELIEKKLVEKQLAFLLIALRQKILTVPTSYARKLMHKEDIKEIHAILRDMAYRLLDEIKNLPTQVTDPNWLQSLEEEEEDSANRERKGKTKGVSKE